MRIEVAREKIYIPAYGGNREQPETEQMKVVHRFLTPAERGKYLRLEPLKIKGGEVSDEREYIQDEEGIARAIILRIENLVISSNGKEILIDTGAKLFDTAGVPYELVQEIALYCLTATPEITRDPTG